MGRGGDNGSTALFGIHFDIDLGNTPPSFLIDCQFFIPTGSLEGFGRSAMALPEAPGAFKPSYFHSNLRPTNFSCGGGWVSGCLLALVVFAHVPIPTYSSVFDTNDLAGGVSPCAH